MNRDDAAQHPVEALSALIDGEVGAAERGPLEAHLEACAVCRDLLEDLRAIDRSVAAEPVPAPPPDLARRIAAALPRREAAPPAPAAVPRSRPFFRAPMPLAAAASLMVATLVWLAWPGGRPAPAPEPIPTAAPARVEAPAAAPAVPPQGPAGSPSLDKAGAPPESPCPAPENHQKADRRAASESGASRARQAPAATARGQAPADSDQSKDRAPAAPAQLDALVPAASEAGVGRTAPRDASAARGPAYAAAPAPVREETKISSEFIDAVPLSETPRPWIRVEPYLVRLLPANVMQVETGAYACTVTLTPEDAGILAAQYALLQPATDATPARSDAPAAAAPSAGNEARPPAAKRAVAGAGVTAIDVTPEARALLLTLVRQRSRAAIEQQCGPLPR